MLLRQDDAVDDANHAVGSLDVGRYDLTLLSMDTTPPVTEIFTDWPLTVLASLSDTTWDAITEPGTT